MGRMKNQQPVTLLWPSPNLNTESGFIRPEAQSDKLASHSAGYEARARIRYPPCVWIGICSSEKRFDVKLFDIIEEMGSACLWVIGGGGNGRKKSPAHPDFNQVLNNMGLEWNNYFYSLQVSAVTRCGCLLTSPCYSKITHKILTAHWCQDAVYELYMIVGLILDKVLELGTRYWIRGARYWTSKCSHKTLQ